MASSIGSEYPAGEQNPCPIHPDMDIMLVCMNCNYALACQMCVSEFHSKHLLIDLHQVTQQSIKNIKRFMKEAQESYIPILQHELHCIHEKMDDNRNKIQSMIFEIQKQAERLKSLIEKIMTKMVAKCKEMYKGNWDSMVQHKEKLKSLRKEIEDNFRKCEKIVTTNDSGLLIETEKATKKHFRLNKPTPPILVLADFIPGIGAADKDMESVFGALTIREELCREESFDQTAAMEKGVVASDDLNVQVASPEPVMPYSPRLPAEITVEAVVEGKRHKESQIPSGHVVHQFQYRASIHAIACKESDNTCAILEKGSVKIDFLTHKGRVDDTVKSKSPVHDIYVSPATSRLWTCSNDTVLEKAPSKVPSVKLKPGDDLCCLCVTVADHIAIGSPLKVRLYNLDGKKLYKTRPGLVALPIKLAACSKTNRIAVVDTDEFGFGGKDFPHVKVLTQDLQLKFKVTAETIHPPEASFSGESATWEINPQDVCFDSAGSLFVADSYSFSIVQISRSGRFVKTFYTDNLTPVAIHLQQDTEMWVGFGDDKNTVKVIKYKK